MLDIILLAILAAFIIKKLFNMLGSNDSSFNTAMDPIVQQFYKKNDIQQETKVDIDIISAAEAALPHDVRNVFDEIRKIDATFNADSFINGAKRAFEMIIKAFADNDKNVLKNLVNHEIFKEFSNNIDARVANKQKLEQNLIGINKFEIISADLNSGIATISVKIVSDQVIVLKDYLGNVLDGNQSAIKTNEDLWKFTRNIKKDRVWFLTETSIPA